MKKIISQHGSAAVIALIIVTVAALFSAAVQDRISHDPQVAVSIDRLIAVEKSIADLQAQTEALGATNKIPDLRALYEDSLASKITSSATSFTLVRGTSNGVTLASSTYPFIIDEGSASEEFVLADCTGTTCTNVTRGISLTTGTTTVASLQKAHGRGASVKITDGPILLIHNRLLQGVDTFPNILAYQSAPTFTTGNQIITKTYADGLVISGGVVGSNTVPGIYLTATGLQAASTTADGTYSATTYLRVIPSSIATSSPGTAGLWSVMTNNAGKIAQAFLDFAQTTVWTALHTFSGGLTSTATTTLSGSNYLSNALVINTVPYQFPSTIGASSTALVSDGVGRFSWGGFSGKHFVQATQTTLSQGATTTVISTTVPGGTLGTNGAIRCTVPVTMSIAADAGAKVTYGWSYGGVSTTTATMSGNGTSVLSNINGTITLLIAANGATNAQRLTQSGTLAVSTVVTTQQTLGMLSAGTAAVDSTAANTLIFQIRPDINTTAGTADTVVCEVIR